VAAGSDDLLDQSEIIGLGHHQSSTVAIGAFVPRFVVSVVQRPTAPSQLKYFAISSSEASNRSPRTTLLSFSLTSAYLPKLSSLIERNRDL